MKPKPTRVEKRIIKAYSNGAITVSALSLVTGESLNVCANIKRKYALNTKCEREHGYTY